MCSLKVEEGSRREESIRGRRLQKEGTERCAVFSIKMEERAIRQGMWVAPRSWKRQGNRPRVPQKEHSSSNILILAG